MDTSLREGLGRCSLNEEETAGAAKEIANGVTNLHQTEPVGIIHRDVKRGNLWSSKFYMVSSGSKGDASCISVPA